MPRFFLILLVLVANDGLVDGHLLRRGLLLLRVVIGGTGGDDQLVF